MKPINCAAANRTHKCGCANKDWLYSEIKYKYMQYLLGKKKDFQLFGENNLPAKESVESLYISFVRKDV